jgi:hypothetical protein
MSVAANLNRAIRSKPSKSQHSQSSASCLRRTFVSIELVDQANHVAARPWLVHHAPLTRPVSRLALVLRAPLLAFAPLDFGLLLLLDLVCDRREVRNADEDPVRTADAVVLVNESATGRNSICAKFGGFGA